jgi:polysaccharide chain length determinant protein (PEP-CTERM system associated)
MIPGKKYSPEDFLEIAWRRKWLLLFPPVLGFCLAVEWARFQPDQYRAQTVIMVTRQSVPDNYVRSTVTAKLADRLQSLSQQILSRSRLERVILDFNLYPDLRKNRFMEEVVEEMRRNIDPQMVKGDTFKISYVSTDPKQAVQVVERLASLYIDENLKDREVLAEGTNQFLETQLEDARRRLVEHEKKLEQYNRQHGGELPTQLTSNLQVLNGAQMQLQAVGDSINRDRDRRLTLERQLADLTTQAAALESDARAPAAIPSAPAARTPTENQLIAARKDLKDLELRLKPAHPDIARANRLVQQLEEKVQAERAAIEASAGPDPAKVVTALNPTDPRRRLRVVRDEMDTVDRQIEAKQKEETRLQGVIAEYQNRVEAAPTRESELIELTRDYSTIQQMYRNLLAKNEDAKISANLERRQIGEQFRVVDPARRPEAPFSPNRGRIATVGAFFGAVLSIGLAVLLEYRDSSLKTDEDVLVALSLPVLALVPLIESATDSQRRRRRRVLLSLSSAATLLAVVVSAIILFKFSGRP